MGQQASSESRCLATVRQLADELNTTDRQVSESRVLQEDSLRLCFPWREWSRVSRHLERVFPVGEQLRLLEHVLLDQSGLRSSELAEIWEAVNGFGETSEFVADEATSMDTPSLNLNSAPVWSVHFDHGDPDAASMLHRDFVKLHFHVENVFSIFNASSSVSKDSGLSMHVAGGESSASLNSTEFGQHDSVTVRGRRQQVVLPAPELQSHLATFVDKIAELVRERCAKLGVGVLVSRARHHAKENCVSVTCTVDVRSVLKNSGGIELRSRPNEQADEQDLADSLQRSFNRIGALKDRLVQEEPQEEKPDTHFPMVMYYCDSRKRVIVIYGMRPVQCS